MKPHLDYGREPIRRRRKINIWKSPWRDRVMFRPKPRVYALGTLISFITLSDHDPFKGWWPQVLYRDRNGDRRALVYPGVRLKQFMDDRRCKWPHLKTFADRAPRVHSRSEELRMWRKVGRCYAHYRMYGR